MNDDAPTETSFAPELTENQQAKANAEFNRALALLQQQVSISPEIHTLLWHWFMHGASWGVKQPGEYPH